MTTKRKLIGCVGHDCAECKKRDKVLAELRRNDERYRYLRSIARKAVCGWLIDSPFPSNGKPLKNPYDDFDRGVDAAIARSKP